MSWIIPPDIKNKVEKLFLDLITMRNTSHKEIINPKVHEQEAIELENNLRDAISECHEKHILQKVADDNDIRLLSLETLKILFVRLFELGGKNAENLKRFALHAAFLDTDHDARNPSDFVKNTLKEYRRLSLKLPEDADVPEFEPIISEYEKDGKRYKCIQYSEIGSFVEPL